MTQANQRKRKERLWREDPHCYWCGCETILLPREGGNKRKVMPPNLATIDHLRPRHASSRREPNPECRPRTVLACWKCNNERDAHDYNALPKEELWRRTGGYPLLMKAYS